MTIVENGTQHLPFGPFKFMFFLKATTELVWRIR